MKELVLAELGEIVRVRDESAYRGVPEPRIHTKLNDLPSKGHEMIDFAAEIGIPLMDWQKFVAIHGHKIKPWRSYASNAGLKRKSQITPYLPMKCR